MWVGFRWTTQSKEDSSYKSPEEKGDSGEVGQTWGARLWLSTYTHTQGGSGESRAWALTVGPESAGQISGPATGAHQLPKRPWPEPWSVGKAKFCLSGSSFTPDSWLLGVRSRCHQGRGADPTAQPGVTCPQFALTPG